MTVTKIPKAIAINPHELAQKVANEGLKGTVDKAIEASEKEYRTHYKKLLESKKTMAKGISRFSPTEADSVSFLEDVYQNLPPFFKKMVNDAVEEQAKINKLTEKHQQELRLELANVIDQEIRLKGKFA